MELRNTVGILTGASRGIGVRLAERLADRGVHLALAARSAEGLEQTAEKIRARGVRVLTVPTDVTEPSDLQTLVGRATEELGPVDLLVNNAGVEMVGYFQELDPKAIESAIATNLNGVILLTRMVVPGMIERGRGHVVNISSAAGKTARPYGSVYAATKHGVVGFSWSLRAELHSYGIGVSVVCPSYVTDVGMFAERERQAGKVPAALKPVTVDRVADETVKAIERDRAEVVVGPPVTRIADVVTAFSPDLVMRIGRRSGLYDYLRKEATGD